MTKLIKQILKIIMLGIVFIFLAFTNTDVGGVYDMNVGQPRVVEKVHRELEFPNIVLVEEIDWVEKLGITFTGGETWENTNWNSLLGKIANKYPFANIVVTKNALAKLKLSSFPLLPPYFDILTTTDPLSARSFMTIEMRGFDIVNYISNAKIEYNYSKYSNIVADSHIDYVFTLVFTYNDTKGQQVYDNGSYQWHINNPILVYDINYSSPTYNDYIIKHTPQIGDVFEFDMVIASLPLLNPVMSGREVPFKVKATVSLESSDLYSNVNFIQFAFGTDTGTNDEYRFIYNGYFVIYYYNNFDGTYTASISSGSSKIWLQMYKKASADVSYTMTHREEVIGNANCYISQIRLLP